MIKFLGRAVFSLLICNVHLTECSYYVTYVFQSDSILYVCQNVKKVVLEMTPTRLEFTTSYFVNKHSTIWSNWPNDGVVLQVVICTVYLSECFFQVTYAL